MLNIHDIHKILISSIIFANCLLTLMYPKKFSHEKTKRKPTFPTRRERERKLLQGVRKGTAGIEPAKSIKSNLAAVRKRSEKTRGQ